MSTRFHIKVVQLLSSFFSVLAADRDWNRWWTMAYSMHFDNMHIGYWIRFLSLNAVFVFEKQIEWFLKQMPVKFNEDNEILSMPEQTKKKYNCIMHCFMRTNE